MTVACRSVGLRRPAALLALAWCLLAALAGAEPGRAAPTGPSAEQGPCRERAPEALAERASQSPKTARALLAALASVGGLEARFVEEKKLALLRAPLRSAGVLYFARPGLLARHVVTPEPSWVRIAPGRILIADPAGERRVDLRARPDVRLFVESFTRVLEGDHEGLAEAYSLQFEPAVASASGEPQKQARGRPAPGGSRAWQLTLTPRARPLSDLVARIEITGRALSVEQLRVVETKGDTTTTRLSCVDAARTFSEAEKASLFGIVAGP